MPLKVIPLEEALELWPGHRDKTEAFIVEWAKQRGIAIAGKDQVEAPRDRITDKLLDLDQLSRLPEPAPIIDNTLDLRTIAMLNGQFGSGKSFIALDWALCIATGKPWQGRSVVESGGVLYIAAEGAYGLNRRINAWRAAWGMSIDPRSFAVLPVAAQVTKPDVFHDLYRHIHSSRPLLIVVDTLARSSVGLDVDNARDAGIAFDAFFELRQATGDGCLLALHHTGKQVKRGKYTARGSSVFEDNSDTVYLAEADGAEITLERMKRKDGPTPDSHTLQLTPVPGTDSVVLQGGKVVGNTGADAYVLSHLVSHFSELGASASTLVESTGLSKTAVYRALDSLKAQGKILNVGTRGRAQWLPAGTR